MATVHSSSKTKIWRPIPVGVGKFESESSSKTCLFDGRAVPSSSNSRSLRPDGWKSNKNQITKFKSDANFSPRNGRGMMRIFRKNPKLRLECVGTQDVYEFLPISSPSNSRKRLGWHILCCIYFFQENKNKYSSSMFEKPPLGSGSQVSGPPRGSVVYTGAKPP